MKELVAWLWIPFEEYQNYLMSHSKSEAILLFIHEDFVIAIGYLEKKRTFNSEDDDSGNLSWIKHYFSLNFETK